MQPTEGGRVDIAELLRRFGEEPLRRELEAFGCSPKGDRCRCPFACAEKGPERERDARIFGGKHPRVFCHACDSKGDLVDVLQLARGLTRDEAVAHLAGEPVPARPRPHLVAVPQADEKERLSPAEAKRLWDSMAKVDNVGRHYLESRSLEDGVELDLVRFATEQHPDEKVRSRARAGYRVAVQLLDVVGNPRGVQLRLARAPRAKEPKTVNLKGSSPGKAFFGNPALIEAEPVVCVAEGLADTLALASWAGKRAGVAVIGAAGKGVLPNLADELEAAGVDIKGKLFALFVQNDRPENKSRRQFALLGQRLAKREARIVWVQTHDEFKDLAEWRHARPDGEWPPAELAKAYEPESGDETPAENRRVLPDGCAVPIPGQIRAEYFAQDFSTLCTLLDEPMHREAVMGAGALTWCEMTWRVRYGGREIAEVDLSSIRLGLEGQGRSTDNKPLKFSEDDVAKAISVLARRKVVHPVRDWLGAQEWDKHWRLETELPLALGHEPGSFSSTLMTRWFIASVARAMRPGCKVDTVLVLVGAQGTRKSSFFACLGGEWFTDSPVNVSDKDGKLVMRRAWIVEWAELDAMRRARDQETIKAFLSAKVDLFRKPYGRDVVEAPRHCVIVGTTNNREFLHDESGNRRFWPVEVHGLIDVDWVRDNRAQLFAEAVYRYRAGEQWWLTPAEEQQLAELNREHEARHIWFDPIEDWLEAHSAFEEVTAGQVLHGAIGKEMDKWTSGEAREVARIMMQLGWRQRRGGGRGDTRRRMYVRPR